MRKSFISPSKYVQGEDELFNLGYFIKTFGDSAILIANPDDSNRVKEKLDATQKKYGVEIVLADFKGECSPGEIKRIQEIAKQNHCACTIGLGGGKAIDTAKCVAEGEPLIICPTIAASDAPTSHSAVVYNDDHTFNDYYYFKQSPSVVLIDTSVIAQAPVRFLVSGMGDALSTYFEARANDRSRKRGVNAGLPCGVREGKCDTAYGTQTAIALAQLCYENLIKYGVEAKKACEMKVVTPAFENIIETNILLSGLGFESGGLGAAHAIYDGMTVLTESEIYMHGEKVAFGTICQLVLEDAPKKEINEVLDFCLSVGLPVCLEDMGVTDKSYDRIYAVAEKACIPEESIHALPLPAPENGFDIVKATANAILAADAIGSAYKVSYNA
jgi:glycerol dehydrogenase